MALHPSGTIFEALFPSHERQFSTALDKDARDFTIKDIDFNACFDACMQSPMLQAALQALDGRGLCPERLRERSDGEPHDLRYLLPFAKSVQRVVAHAVAHERW